MMLFESPRLLMSHVIEYTLRPSSEITGETASSVELNVGALLAVVVPSPALSAVLTAGNSANNSITLTDGTTTNQQTTVTSANPPTNDEEITIKP